MKSIRNAGGRFFALILVLGIWACTDVDNILPKVTSAFTYTVDAESGIVSFINLSEGATKYSWNFGDGTSSTEINPVKSYQASGTYTITLQASNGAGGSDTAEDSVSIVILVPPSLPLTFDIPSVKYEPTVFGGASFAIVDNPDVSGSNDKASKVGAITNSGNAFEGLFFDLAAPVDLSTDKTITLNLWAEAAVPVLLKLEEGSEAAIELTADHGGTGWESLSFQFDSSASYSRITLFVDGPGTSAGIFYLDDIAQASAGGGGGGGAVPPTAPAPDPTQAAADVISIYSDAYTDVPKDGFAFYGAAAFEEVDIAGSGNSALKYTFVDVGGGNFQVIELGGANQIDAAAAGMTNFRFDLYFPNEVEASTNFLMKLVDFGATTSEAQLFADASSSPAIAQGSWLSFDFTLADLTAAGLAGSSNIQQVVVDLLSSGEVYIDNIYFYR